MNKEVITFYVTSKGVIIEEHYYNYKTGERHIKILNNEQSI
mgnify:CR=1 FL=1